jgi:hypothetical protein
VSDDQPVLNTIAEVTAVSFVRGTLDAREHMIARLAALVAVGAPTVSYVLNFEPAAEVGLTLVDAQGLLVAVAPTCWYGAGRVSGGEAYRRFRLRDRSRHRRSRTRGRSRARGRSGTRGRARSRK